MRALLNFSALISGVFILCLASVSSSSSSRSSSAARPGGQNNNNSLKLNGLRPDKFVTSAPLVIAAVYRDGVALVATHPADEDDIQTLGNIEGEEDASANDKEVPAEDSSTRIPDLPESYRGPLRVHKIDSVGTALVGAGWRTDCEQLAKLCRNYAAKERERFGEPSGSPLEYGHYLATMLSQAMSFYAFSDNVRALSCVGLLASCGSNSGPGYLWLVDATGCYRVRAHALGAGDGVLNERLRRLDFSKMTREECLKRLVALICEKSVDKDKPFELPPGTKFEAAVVDSAFRKMTRIRQPFFAVTDKTS